MRNSTVAVVSLLAAFHSVWCLPQEPEKTFVNFYEWGVGAYSEERWYECVAFMRRALEDYKYEKSVLNFCRKKCNIKVTMFFEKYDEGKDQDMNYPGSELEFFDRSIKKSLCIKRCHNEQFGTRRPKRQATRKMRLDFETLQPYSYIQLCHWQLGELEEATSAAFTFLSRNPNDEMMSENLEFYRSRPDFNEKKMLRDREETEHQRLYLEGATAYSDENYMEVIDNMEKALDAYWQEDEECRLACEDHFEIGNLSAPELYTSIAEIYEGVLRCKVNCSTKLNVIRGNRLPDLVPSHYHYLQYAYWKAKNPKKAIQACLTYLIFYPEDETMLTNKKFYMEKFDFHEGDVKPTVQPLRYYQRQYLERRILDFIEVRMKITDDEHTTETADDYMTIKYDVPELEPYKDLIAEAPPRKYVAPGKPKEKPKGALLPRKGDEGSLAEIEKTARNILKAVGKTFLPGIDESPGNELPYGWKPSNETLSRYQERLGIEVTKKEEDLNGTGRYVAEKALSPQDCKNLMSLYKFMELGDGYKGKGSPHTKNEMFHGLTVSRLSELAAENRLPLELAKLFMDKSELVRDFTESYFNLSSHLYFDYTHIACRNVNPKIGEKRRKPELSHPVHGDNCMLLDGECKRQYPAYIWRDYSALLYLNDDFEGGEFFFTDSNLNVQAEVKPGCGHMIGFRGETPHGVKGITSGTRCVLALWMTLDPDHQEKERIEAQQVLAELEFSKNGNSAENGEDNEDDLEAEEDEEEDFDDEDDYTSDHDHEL